MSLFTVYSLNIKKWLRIAKSLLLNLGFRPVWVGFGKGYSEANSETRTQISLANKYRYQVLVNQLTRLAGRAKHVGVVVVAKTLPITPEIDV